MENLNSIVSHFAYKGELQSIMPTGNGHINRTYKVVTSHRKYILQRINNDVFQNVDDLMNNIVLVTEHLLDKNIFTLKYVPSKDGKLYYANDEGYFRMYKFVENSICYEGIDDLKIIEKAGEAFGALHNALADLDTNDIVDVIPNFHNTMLRYRKLLESIARDPVGRVKDVKHIISYIVDHSDDASMLSLALRSGEIRNTITHNDPKINNILFDKDTNNVKCVIDLDTVMTGTVLYDFGDALRSLFTGDNENKNDESLMNVRLDVYEAYLKGYFSEMKNVLNEKEIELLPYSVIVLTYELAVRFLTDYIDGDIYFATSYPTENLDRTMSQFYLLRNLYNNLEKMKEITNRICK